MDLILEKTSPFTSGLNGFYGLKSELKAMESPEKNIFHLPTRVEQKHIRYNF